MAILNDIASRIRTWANGKFATQSDLANKQDTLVSGTNIKTVGGSSILGSGDLGVSGGGTVQNANLSIQPASEGTPAGNARGNNSVDLQTNRNTADQVVSGAYSFQVGYRNKTSGGYSVSFGGNNIVPSDDSGAFGRNNNLTGANNAAFAFGRFNEISRSYTVAIGNYAKGYRMGQIAHTADRQSITGDSQTCQYSLLAQTVGATTSKLTADKTGFNHLSLPDNSIIAFDLFVAGKISGQVNGYAYKRKIVAARGTTYPSATILQNETIGTDYEANASANISVSTGGAWGEVFIEVTGVAGQTINWSGFVRSVEVIKA